MKFLKVLPLLFLLIGCNKEYSNSISVSNTFETNYSIEPYFFNFDNIKENSEKKEFRTVYNDNIYVNEIIYEDIYCYTGHIYKYNLINHDIEEITSVKKNESENRIYDIFKLSKDDYLFIEITPNKVDGDFGLIYYSLYLQKENEKKLIIDGYTESVFKVPIFQVIDDKIYINATSLIFDETSNTFTNKYENKVIKFHNNDFEVIFDKEYKNLVSSNLIIYNKNQIKLLINSDGICKEVKIDNELEKIIYEDFNNEFYERITPVNDGYYISVTDWNDENYASKYISNEYNESLICDDYRFVDYVQLDDITLAITNDGELFGLKFEDNTLFIKRINEIEYSIYFRKIDQNTTLIYSSNDNVYKLSIKE